MNKKPLSLLKVHTVLCYLEKNECYLMLLRNKKHDDMNEGKWLGVGGHIESGETPDMAVIREVYEETGYTLENYSKRGIITFINNDYEEVMHLYTSDSFKGELKECNEGTLKWIPKVKIMDLNLWDGDRIFLRKMMEDNTYMNIKLYYENDKFVRSDEGDLSAVYKA